MTSDELDKIRISLDMRHSDLAVLGGVTTRCVREWTSGRRPVPRAIAILMKAIENGFITETWLLKQIKRH